DPDGDTLTYTVTDPPANGSVTIDAVLGTYTYTPATRPEFGEPDGAASFTVLASDGELTASTTFDVPIAALPTPDATPTLQGTAQLPGDPSGPVVVGPDGTAYQSVVFGLGTSNQHTSVYALNPDGSGALETVVDMAEGGADSGLMFAPERYVFQTTFDYDSQTGYLLVIDLQNPGTFAAVGLGSGRVFDDDVSISPDGSAYVLTGGQLLVVDPENTSAPVSIDLTGTAADGPVVFNQLSGTPYVAEESDDAEERVQLFEIDITSPDDPLIFVTESPGSLPADGLVSGPDGSIYLTTWSVDGDTATTHVVVIDPDNPGVPMQFEMTGTAFNGVAFGPDGDVYQAAATISIEGDDFSSLQTTTEIMRIDLNQVDDPETYEVLGALDGPIIVGPGGIIYAGVTVSDYTNFPDITTIYQLVVIDPQDPDAAFAVELNGPTIINGDFQTSNVAIGQDGRAYIAVTTETEVGGDTVYTTRVTVVDPNNPEGTIQIDHAIAGAPPNEGSQVAVDGNGLVYVTTQTLGEDGFVTHVTVIDPGNATDQVLATYDIDGPAVGGPVVDPGNTAYQTAVGGDIDDESTDVAVIGVAPVD
ncbi:MAG: hypothetical protein WBB57_02030, partial [Mycobacterium sp.]